MGLMTNMDYMTYEFTLHPGESLFIYSDGLLDANEWEGAGSGRSVAGAIGQAVRLRRAELPEGAVGSAAGQQPYTARDIVAAVEELFFRRKGDAPLGQDVTVLCLKNDAKEAVST